MDDAVKVEPTPPSDLRAGTTPGPWIIEIEAEPDEGLLASVYVCHPGTECDATVVATMGTASSVALEQRIADARLIASAPDLAAQVARLKADKAALVEAMQEIIALPGEINPSNYDHDDACALNASFCEGFQIARAAIEAHGRGGGRGMNKAQHFFRTGQGICDNCDGPVEAIRTQGRIGPFICQRFADKVMAFRP